MDTLWEITVFFLVIAALVGVYAFAAATPQPESSAIVDDVVSQPVVYNITPTPTPEPTLSDVQVQTVYEGMPPGRWFRWIRDNVSGYKDLDVSVTVYGYRMYNYINWYSVSWGQYFMAAPQSEDNKFLLVFINMWSSEDSPRQYLFDKDYFSVQIGNQTYYATEETLIPQVRIRELDEVWDLQHKETIQPFGYLRTYNSENLPIAIPHWWLTPGKSNAMDGYIVFEVPRSTRPEDVRVLANFEHLGGVQRWRIE